MRLASGTLLTSLALVALPRAGAAQAADSGGRAAATGAAQAPATRDSATASSAAPAPLDADSIAARAIARRHAALAAFQHVSYDAFVKLVARDFRRPTDSTGSVVFISEKRSTAYWEHHRRYQETVTARRQTRAFEVPRSLVAVDDILDVERSHVGLATYTSAERAGGSERGRSGRGRTAASGYSVLSPFARSAPESYAYQLLDTVNVDGRRVFRLAVIPRSSATPLFVGTVEVADSTFDPVAVDLGVNEGVQFTSVTNLRYQERLHDVGGGRWMPYEIRLAGEVRPKITVPGVPRTIAGVPVPGLPERARLRAGRVARRLRVRPGG